MPHTTRRSFLSRSAAAGILAPLGASATGQSPAGAPTVPSAAPKKLRVLMLGGTGFLGPAVVERALERGHDVTLFNRGRTNPKLFPDLKRLKGDRNKGDYASLEGQEFDVVVDTTAYVPGHVTAAIEALKGKCRHYSMVSSISVYPAFGDQAIDVDESAPTAEVPADFVAKAKTIRDAIPQYGGMKKLCEEAAEAALPGKVVNIRAGLIVGPRDRSDRFTWWPVRFDRGGEVLAPGNPQARIQAVDVRDLGNWIVHCFEKNVTGVYNATGYHGTVTMADLMHGCKNATSKPVTITWADDAFLLENKVGPWMQMPMWLTAKGNTYAVNTKAVEQGLTFRPMADTIRDTLEWAKTERGDRPFARTGVRPEREAELLKKWHARAGGGAPAVDRAGSGSGASSGQSSGGGVKR